MQYKIFGCKVNKYYTDKWLNSAYLKNKKGIFVATCVVTDQAKKKWIRFLKNTCLDLKKGEKVFISGCGAFKDGEVQGNFFSLYPELLEFKDIIEILPEKVFDNKNIIFKGLKNNIYTKKFILIQSGCDSFCSFCLTVQKRGKHFSRKKEDIVKDILDFEKIGGKEVVLTGINLSAWGQETTNDFLNPKFKDLLKYILDNTKIQRIRISSLGPEFIDKNTIKIFANKRIYPHFHISLQSGSNSILKAMKRHYTKQKLEELLLSLRNLKRKDNVNISIGADIIVAFPGETDSDFKETIDLICKYKINKVHAFPFSPHNLGENVPAGFFPNQISEEIKKIRMKKILEISDKVRNNFISENIGKEFEILVEQVDNFGNWKGWTQNYIEANNSNINLISGKIEKGEIIRGLLVKYF